MTNKEKRCAGAKEIQRLRPGFETEVLAPIIAAGAGHRSRRVAVLLALLAMLLNGACASGGSTTARPAAAPVARAAPVEDPEGPEEPSVDAIDLSTVHWLHADVSDWEITSEITSFDIGEQEICVHHTAAGTWPAPNGTYGNPWIFAEIDGTWYAGTFEWMRPGQECKELDPGAGGATIADRIGLHVKLEPLESWKPKKGDKVGLMYSGWARDGRRSVEERSNVVLVTWPF